MMTKYRVLTTCVSLLTVIGSGACSSDSGHGPLDSGTAGTAGHHAADGGGSGATASMAMLDSGQLSAPDSSAGDGGETAILMPLDASVAPAANSGSGPALRDAGREPEDVDDGGSQPTDPPPCVDRRCLCDQLCQQAARAACPDVLPIPDCTASCLPEPPVCPAQAIALLKCQVTQPEANLACDPDFGTLVISGCLSEEVAVGSCAGSG